MSRRRTSWINIRNFIGTTSLRTSRPLSVTSMLPRVDVGGSRASTATYFVPSVSYAIRGHSRKTCDQEIRHRGTCPRMNAARRPAISSAAVCMSMRDAPHPLALLRPRREQPRSGTMMKWRRLVSSVGSPPGTRCASLPQVQDASEAPAGPWGETRIVLNRGGVLPAASLLSL